MWLSLMLITCVNSAVSLDRRRIILGMRANSVKYLNVAAVMRSHNSYGYLVCGATVVSPTAVLTAAHCVSCTTTNRQYFVHAGANDLRKGDWRKVVDIQCHNGGHDIAMLRVDKAFSSNVPVTKVPRVVRRDATCEVVGWGARDVEEAHRRFVDISCIGEDCLLMQARVRQVSTEQCLRDLARADASDTVRTDGSQICAIGVNGTDSCHGDSGGPIFCDGQLYGIVSWGIGCGQPGIPSVNVLVPHFAEWIAKVLRKWKT